jgi:hypothetical protein
LGHDSNWTNKLARNLSAWKRRTLTLFGKCTIINTLAISNLVYLASVYLIPKRISLKCNKKGERIKGNTLIGNVKQGGIGMVGAYLPLNTEITKNVTEITDKITEITSVYFCLSENHIPNFYKDCCSFEEVTAIKLNL